MRRAGGRRQCGRCRDRRLGRALRRPAARRRHWRRSVRAGPLRPRRQGDGGQRHRRCPGSGRDRDVPRPRPPARSTDRTTVHPAAWPGRRLANTARPLGQSGTGPAVGAGDRTGAARVSHRRTAGALQRRSGARPATDRRLGGLLRTGRHAADHRRDVPSGAPRRHAAPYRRPGRSGFLHGSGRRGPRQHGARRRRHPVAQGPGMRHDRDRRTVERDGPRISRTHPAADFARRHPAARAWNGRSTVRKGCPPGGVVAGGSRGIASGVRRAPGSAWRWRPPSPPGRSGQSPGPRRGRRVARPRRGLRVAGPRRGHRGARPGRGDAARRPPAIRRHAGPGS